MDGDLESIRAASALPILTSGDSDADARVVRPTEEFDLGDGIELVVRVEDEDELEAALERLDLSSSFSARTMRTSRSSTCSTCSPTCLPASSRSPTSM